MNTRRNILRLYLGVTLSFVLVKFLLRPFVLEQEWPAVFQIFVLSYPNFCEAVLGTVLVTLILIMINKGWVTEAKRLAENQLYLPAMLLAGAYVILQEIKVHNLGGENIYDPYDVLFSVLGLLAAYGWLRRVGPLAGGIN